VDNGLDKMMCVKNCPDGYYKTEDKRCVEKWTTIAFQNAPFDNTEYLLRALEVGSRSEPFSNFFDFNNLQVGGNFEKEGKWKFRFDWQLENAVLGQLVWTQTFSPDQPDATLSVDVTHEDPDSRDVQIDAVF